MMKPEGMSLALRQVRVGDGEGKPIAVDLCVVDDESNVVQHLLQLSDDGLYLYPIDDEFQKLFFCGLDGRIALEDDYYAD